MSELNLPTFMTDPLPRIQVPDWLSDDMKATAKDVEEWIAKAEKGRDETKALMERLVENVDLMCNDIPTKEQRRKTRLTLLQCIMTARTMADEFFGFASKDTVALQGPKQAAIGEAKIAARRALAAAGFEKTDPDEFPHNSYSELVDQHVGVIAARRESIKLRDYVESVYEQRRVNAARLADVKAELGKIRDSMVREAVLV